MPTVRRFIRTCQECGYEQTMKNPNEMSEASKRSENWRDVKCKRCKSIGSMDFGSYREFDSETGKEIFHDDDEEE